MEAQPSAHLAPVGAAERIEAMDVLRGFALLGILLMNIEAFVGPMLGAVTGLDPALRGADRWADALIYILVQGKFYTLFSLLFGMGFAVMLARAEQAGRSFATVYLRRSLALLAIGLGHALLVWSGDILVVYALLSFVLLLGLRNLPLRWVPWLGIAIYLMTSALVMLFGAIGSLMALAPPEAAAGYHQAMQQQATQVAAELQAQRTAFGGGDYAAAVAQRGKDLLAMMGYLMFFGPQVLGMFVLGSWFVRSGAIARPQEFPRLYSRLRWLGLPLGLALMLASFRMMPTMAFDRMDLASSTATSLGAIGSALMCLGYLAWLVRGLDSPAWRPGLGLLAPAGRMALTNYLTQSLVCTAIFYGHGLGYFEQLPRAWQVPFAFGLYALQVAFSHAWLRHFRFGPMEWLWRAATYLRLPPMRQVATV
jgi:uncharacterized protein